MFLAVLVNDQVFKKDPVPCRYLLMTHEALKKNKFVVVKAIY
jgi:hypothetical protein